MQGPGVSLEPPSSLALHWLLAPTRSTCFPFPEFLLGFHDDPEAAGLPGRLSGRRGAGGWKQVG